MKVAVTVIRDVAMPGTDYEHWQFLVSAFRRRGLDVDLKTFKMQFQTLKELAPFIESEKLDRPADLHLLAQSYQRTNLHLYPWKNAGRYWHYNQDDRPILDSPHKTIQVLRSKKHPQATTILAPYGFFPFFRWAFDASSPQNRNVDVWWCGGSRVPMGGDATERGVWLSEFEDILSSPGYDHIRYVCAGEPLRIDVHDYVTIMRRAKICLSLRGFADHCGRILEVMHCGCCLVGQHIQREEIYHGPISGARWFETPREAADICRDLLATGQWSENAALGSQWYQEHYGREAMERWGDETVTSMLDEDQ